MAHFLAQIQYVCERRGCKIADLGIGGVARGCLARPEVYPGVPTPIETKDPIMKTDTNKHADYHKIHARMEEDIKLQLDKNTRDDGLKPKATAEDATIATGCDGQGFNMEGQAIKRSYLRYCRFAPHDGGFHHRECQASNAGPWQYVHACR